MHSASGRVFPATGVVRFCFLDPGCSLGTAKWPHRMPLWIFSSHASTQIRYYYFLVHSRVETIRSSSLVVRCRACFPCIIGEEIPTWRTRMTVSSLIPTTKYFLSCLLESSKNLIFDKNVEFWWCSCHNFQFYRQSCKIFFFADLFWFFIFRSVHRPLSPQNEPFLWCPPLTRNWN